MRDQVHTRPVDGPRRTPSKAGAQPGLRAHAGRWIQPDCPWRDTRLIVELDGRAAHDTTSRFDSDRERDRLLALAGWTVVRVTWKHVTKNASELAAHLRALIASRTASPASAF